MVIYGGGRWNGVKMVLGSDGGGRLGGGDDDWRCTILTTVITELAWGLELTQQRFIMVVRKQSDCCCCVFQRAKWVYGENKWSSRVGEKGDNSIRRWIRIHDTEVPGTRWIRTSVGYVKYKAQRSLQTLQCEVLLEQMSLNAFDYAAFMEMNLKGYNYFKWEMCKQVKVVVKMEYGFRMRLRVSFFVADDDVVVLENSETEEEDVKEDESDHNKERYTFEDDDDDGEFDDLD
ncbi:hypothetical protein Tco_1439059 [Tanacetum coccineum]